MSDAVIVALITGVLAFAGTAVGAWLSNRKSTTLILYRLDNLEKKQDKHNSLIERMYKVEKKVALLEQKQEIEHETP